MSTPDDVARHGAIQLHFPGMGPAVGGRYRNRNTGHVASVISVAQRRYGWVTIRVAGETQTIRLDRFERIFQRI